MNKVVLMGRLTRDPDIRYSTGEKSTAVARYTLAVDRRYRRDGSGQEADFISCVAFGRSAEFAEKYFHQGLKIIVTGHIQTGSYTNRDGQKVYTTDVVIEDQEFAESKAASGNSGGQPTSGSNVQASPGNSMSYASDPAGAQASTGNSSTYNPGSAAPAYGQTWTPSASPSPANQPLSSTPEGFMNIPDGIEEELPFG